MSSISRTLLWAAAAIPATFAQTITVNETTVEANSSTLAIAQAVSDSRSNASASYFDVESLQLTDSIIANLTSLNLTEVGLFSFNGEYESASKRLASFSCKYMPGDAMYPRAVVWKVFDLLLGGALLKPAPLAAPCYDDHPNERDAALCSYISANWANNSYIHSDDPTSVMWPLYTGGTCLPTGDASDTCTQGGYPEYVVNATNVAQIQLAVNFARNANLRLVVKNTGHSFIGKSAGAGALSIWIHHLKSMQFFETYNFYGYSGPAFKLGSGVQADELYEAANEHGVTAIGGEGRSVGVAGGFLYGGGHSPLSSIYGLAADHILSMEVVTPDGRFVTASEYSNPELFWALRGGGGGSWGVVTSVVVKVFPKIEVSTLQFSFMSGEDISVDAFWAGVRAYFTYMIDFVDAGCYEYFSLVKIADGVYLFGMAPFFAPNMTIVELEALVAPWMSDLNRLGISVNTTYQYFDNFRDAWWNVFPLETVGSITMKTASRLFPKSNWEDGSKFNATFKAVQETIEAGGAMLAFNIAGFGKISPDFPDTSINPAWRETCLHAILAIFWSENATQDEIVNASRTLTVDWMGKWRNASLGAGSYMSEADVDEPNFQQSFYGTNYDKLYDLKQRYDPHGVFYTPTGVGSEDWYITDQIDYITTQNGRLCRA